MNENIVGEFAREDWRIHLVEELMMAKNKTYDVSFRHPVGQREHLACGRFQAASRLKAKAAFSEKYLGYVRESFLKLLKAVEVKVK